MKGNPRGRREEKERKKNTEGTEKKSLNASPITLREKRFLSKNPEPIDTVYTMLARGPEHLFY
jgi:hypothetical protein